MTGISYTLRQATQEDFPAIRELINRVHINPADLDWHRFIVAVDSSGQMLGCGQLKPHGAGIVELASIAVQSSFRNQGIARAIIEDLIAKAPRPLYLTCRSGLKSLYEKWGFQVVEGKELPRYYRRLAKLASMITWMIGEHLLVMKLS
ncbi:MAG TPA: GNAT family N-acetyltransferase [Anaerolineales bacterium]|nr:GNAT family N-acetyltransferase [Anaerolineales bacterium]